MLYTIYNTVTVYHDLVLALPGAKQGLPDQTKDPLEHLASPLSFLSLSSLSPLFFSLSFPFSLSLKLKFYKKPEQQRQNGDLEFIFLRSMAFAADEAATVVDLALLTHLIECWLVWEWVVVML